ncbi:hypothetical protein Lser_V15G24463 [Lactuca serriola]
MQTCQLSLHVGGVVMEFIQALIHKQHSIAWFWVLLLVCVILVVITILGLYSQHQIYRLSLTMSYPYQKQPELVELVIKDFKQLHKAKFLAINSDVVRFLSGFPEELERKCPL